MFYGNAEMTYTMIICVIVASLTAVFSRLPNRNIMDGLYGFNAALIGCAMIFYFHVNAVVVVAYLLGSVVSTFFMHLFLFTKMPAYTFPFIAITWVLKAVLEHADLADSRAPGPTNDYRSLYYIEVPAHAFGQVMFQGDAISGILMIVGIFISSPMGSLYGIVGSYISTIYTQLYKPSADLITINAGLYSFNAVLSGIASSGDKPIDGLYMLVTVGVATIFYIFLVSKNFTALTFPFVASLWLLQIWKRLILGFILPKIQKRYQSKFLKFFIEEITGKKLDNNQEKEIVTIKTIGNDKEDDNFIKNSDITPTHIIPKDFEIEMDSISNLNSNIVTRPQEIDQ
eukprot:gene8370-10283_t